MELEVLQNKNKQKPKSIDGKTVSRKKQNKSEQQKE